MLATPVEWKSDVGNNEKDQVEESEKVDSATEYECLELLKRRQKFEECDRLLVIPKSNDNAEDTSREALENLEEDAAVAAALRKKAEAAAWNEDEKQRNGKQKWKDGVF